MQTAPVDRRRPTLIALATAAALLAFFAQSFSQMARADAGPAGGLLIVDRNGNSAGECPLEHTSVSADVAGMFGRVSVRQVFHNKAADKIEAVYVFPLPASAAVDDMTLTVGDRVIRGVIKERQEARAIYDAARARGNVAALLDQERANIFTQTVANIEPGARVTVEIKYVETLKYDEGWYEFSFPMVVGPRYIPGQPVSQRGLGWAPDTDRVPDASHITPPVAPKGTRAGHDIDLTVNIDAGRPITGLTSLLHDVDDRRPTAAQAVVALKNSAEIPNRDFVLRYRTADNAIGDALVTHVDTRGGFFTLILEPPVRSARVAAVPRELVFVLDTSGSMSGFPIEKAKEVMSRAISAMRPGDSFNMITFSGDTNILWSQPRPATSANIQAAQEFLATRAGGGGTEMMKAIEAALAPIRACGAAGDDLMSRQPDDARPAQHAMRICCFMTDGYVGNDMEIIDAVKRYAANTRVFSFGIGNSVNRYLLDGMARAGRGEVEYVTLNGDASEAVNRFAERIASPVLADVAIDWNGADVRDLQPAVIPDLFTSKPIVVHGRYERGGEATIRLRGRTAEGSFSRDVRINLPSRDSSHPALASLWARSCIEELTWRDLVGIQQGRPDGSIRAQIIDLGLKFALMTQFTSFVAVEEMRITEGGIARTVAVPVEMPEGVSHEGVFGENRLRAIGHADLACGVRAPAPVGAGGNGPKLMRAGRNIHVDPLGGRADGQPKERFELRQLGYMAEIEESDESRDKKQPSKLAPALQGLAERVAREGREGRYEGGGVTVIDGKIEVIMSLSDFNDETLAALKRLGVNILGLSKSSSTVVARIPVGLLEALARLEMVRHIQPAPRT